MKITLSISNLVYLILNIQLLKKDNNDLKTKKVDLTLLLLY